MSGRGPKTKKVGRKIPNIKPISFKGKPTSLITNKNAAAAISAAEKKPEADPTKRAARIAKPRIITLANVPTMAGAGGGSELAEIELTPLAYAIFGESYVRGLLERGIIGTVRDIWELSTPTTQCGNIIGALTEKTECWICSLPIKDIVGLTAECEHVLPIAQAVLYLGLFSVTAEKKIFPSDMTVLSGEDRARLQLEYRWAHRVCNQVKNDDSYLDFDLTKQQYFVRTDKIQDLLNRIKKNSRSYGAAIKQMLTPAIMSEALKNATLIYQQICKLLNSYKAPRLLELASIISAGYGPRKVSVNPKWEHGTRVVSKEELEGNMRKEIIKANIEYEGIYKKTLILVGNLTEIGAAADSSLKKIIETRRPEYVSLLMRITPSPKNMKYAIAYIRSQLFSELATIDAKSLGLSDRGLRTTANQRFRSLLAGIGAFTPVEPDPKFNAELAKANRLYQEDTSIGDTIRTMLGKYMEELLSAPDKDKPSLAAYLQEELITESSDTRGDTDSAGSPSEYVEIISQTSAIISSMNPASMAASVALSASIASDPWADDDTNAILSREEIKWDILSEEDEKAVVVNVASTLLNLMRSKAVSASNVPNAMAASMRGGDNGTRKIRRRYG